MVHFGLEEFEIGIINPIFRVSARRFDPLSTPPRELQGRGRFDDPTIDAVQDSDGYAVLYGATEPRAAFLEVLYQFRLPISRLTGIANEMVLDTQERDQLFGHAGTIASEWVERTALISATVSLDAPLFDLASPSAVQTLRERFALSLIALGVDDLDFGEVLGHNRELTQAISRWVWSMNREDGEPLFSGIRYRSRLDPECICFALYEDRYSISGDIDIHSITPQTPGFAEAADLLRLEIA